MSLLSPIVRFPNIYDHALCRVSDCKSTLYLTFDDGPCEDTTIAILDLLARYKAHATFFCTGENADMIINLVSQIRNAGHTIGNHGYTHCNALKINKLQWLSEMTRVSSVVDSRYFRPPYGRIWPGQYRQLQQRYTVVFWDVMTYDFAPNVSLDRVCRIIRNKTRNGSILVFHDSAAAGAKMLAALQFTLDYFSQQGFSFAAL